MRRLTHLVVILCFCALILGIPYSARAATIITVTTTADTVAADGFVSLRSVQGNTVLRN